MGNLSAYLAYIVTCGEKCVLSFPYKIAANSQ